MATQLATLDVSSDPERDGSPESISDLSLVRQLVAGSQDALAGLYDRHGQAVFAAALRMSRDRAIAAEVVQDTFLALWNRAEQFDPARGALPAWLVRIARNRAIDRLRADNRHDRSTTFSAFARDDADDAATAEWLMAAGEVIGVGGTEVGPEMALSDKELRASIDGALGALPPLERCVILLAYHAGLSHSEIATRLGWPLGTVKTRTRRALRHLRDQLEQTARPTVRNPGPSSGWWDPRTWCPDLTSATADGSGSGRRRIASSH